MHHRIRNSTLTNLRILGSAMTANLVTSMRLFLISVQCILLPFVMFVNILVVGVGIEPTISRLSVEGMSPYAHPPNNVPGNMVPGTGFKPVTYRLSTDCYYR